MKRADSDSSPPRRQKDKDQSPDRFKKTLGGKLAGLSSAKDMKKEAEKLRLKELEMFNKVSYDQINILLLNHFI